MEWGRVPLARNIKLMQRYRKVYTVMGDGAVITVTVTFLLSNVRTMKRRDERQRLDLESPAKNAVIFHTFGRSVLSSPADA